MRGGNLAIFVPHSGCPNLCSFCDQRAISGANNPPTSNEVVALCTESLEHLGDRAKNCEIAFFGGSFTAIDRDYRLDLLKAVQPFLGENGFAGIRISTRPDAITKEILDELKFYGVTSIELGAQTMVDKVLILNRRGHTASSVVAASALVKDMGFSLGLQMMTGLYGSSAEDDLYTANSLIELSPDTMRIYPAITIENTHLAELYHSHGYIPPTLEESVSIASHIMEMCMDRDIHILKVGLHPSPELEKTIVAGPYHQAFRELCEGEIVLKKVLSQLLVFDSLPKKMNIYVKPNEISKMTGQKKCNILTLKKMGIDAKVIGDKDVKALSPKIEVLET